MDEVSALTPQDGIDFYETYYAPDNAILVVAGDVTGEEVRALAETHYGDIPPAGAQTARKWQPVAPLEDTQEIVFRDPKVRQPVWYRYYSGTSSRRDKDYALALEVGLEVLGGGNTSLLFQQLVEEQQLAIDVGTFAYTSLHDEGPAAIYATPAPGTDLETLETALIAALREQLAAGFDEADVTRVKNSKAASAIYARDSQESMANSFGAALSIGTPIADILSYPEDVRAITSERALEAVRRVFGEEKHFIEAHLLPSEEAR